LNEFECSEVIRRFEIIWHAPTRSPLEITSSNPTHQASTQWNQLMGDGGESSKLWSVPGMKDHTLVRESHHHRLELIRDLAM